MKKGAGVPLKSASNSACGVKNRTNDCSRGQQNSKSLSMVLNRKSRSSQELESSKSTKSSKATSKSAESLGKKRILNESLSKYKVEDITPRELQESLIRVKENPVEPFTFLSNIVNETTADVHVSIERTKPTEIDLQLAALKRRVQLNKSLLERTNEHVKEINFLVEKNSMMASRELNYDDNESERNTASGDAVAHSDSSLTASCPGIMELQRTIKVTKDMLGYVKKICNEEMQIGDLPKELADHMSADIERKRIN